MTTSEQILKHLRRGKRLSVARMAKLFNTYCGGQRIGDLKREGIPVRCEWKVSKAGKRYKEYYL